MSSALNRYCKGLRGGLLALLLAALCGCAHPSHSGASLHQASDAPPIELGSSELRGETHPVLDPSIIRQGSTYYVFSTDVRGTDPGGKLRIRCSEDLITWRFCGSVFESLPVWLHKAMPSVSGLWAPDISFFAGRFHVYYAASTLRSQESIIGVATNTTLDVSDPHYRWVDEGQVLASAQGDDFDAIDPSVLVDKRRIFLAYGSYWTGIKEVELDPETGKILPGAPRYDLAERLQVPNDPIEGASLVHHGRFYYLFASIDHCCQDLRNDNYKEVVGRSRKPTGPFLDMQGVPMTDGGGTVLVHGNEIVHSTGGATVYVDRQNANTLIVFHALSVPEHGTQYLWVKKLAWPHKWPTIVWH